MSVQVPHGSASWTARLSTLYSHRPNSHVALQDNVAAWKTMREMQWSHGDAMGVADVPRGHHELGSVDQVWRVQLWGRRAGTDRALAYL